MKCAQVSPITLVLVSGIIISLVGVTYMWGAPIIEKQSIKTRFFTSTSFIKSLDETIVEIANTGGTAEAEIPFGLVAVISDGEDDGNSVLFQFSSNQPLIFSDGTTYIGDVSYEDVANEIGVFGKSKPGIISLTSRTVGSSIVVEIRLHYRELDSDNPLQGYKISLNKKDRGSGSNKIVIANEGTEVIPGRAANSGDLALTRLSIRVS